MTTTFAARLSGRDGRNLKLCITVQGVPFVFQEDAVNVPATVVSDVASRTVVKGIEKVEVGEKRLDMSTLSMVGGSLVVTMLDPDGSLAALFAPRSRPVTFMAANATAAALVISVDSVTGITGNGEPIYIGAETLMADVPDATTTPDSIDLASRGAFGSVATRHYGDVDGGAPVFLTPPFWKGRRVSLIGYFTNHNGGTSAALSEVLDTFEMDEAPVYMGEGRWEMRASHLSDSLRKRKIGSGLVDGAAAEGAIIEYSGTEFFFDVDDGRQFKQGTAKTHARLELDTGGVAIYAIAGLSGVPAKRVSIGASPTNIVTTEPGNASRIPARVRHIAILEGNAPGVEILRVLLSRLGDGANDATYDRLPGYDRGAFFEDEWRFGAGLRTVDVDVAAFFAFASPIPGWSYVIDDEIPLADFLFDFCLVTGCFWYVTADGKLSVKRLAEERTASSMVLDEDTLFTDVENGGLESTITYDETSIFPRIALTCNYDAASRAFEGTLTLRDAELAARYPTDESVLEIESRALVFAEARIPVPTGGDTGTHVRQSIGRFQLQQILRRIQIGGGRGRAIIICRALVDAMTLDLGDLVTFTDDLPDLEGAEAVTARICRVIAKAPGFDDGTVDLTLEVLETLFHIAPASRIASGAGGTATITLQTTGPEVASTSPGFMFGIGWTLRIHDVSAGTHLDRVVQSVTATTVTFTASVATVIAAGLDFVTIAPQGTIVGGIDSANGFGPSDFVYDMVVPSGANPITRWR